MARSPTILIALALTLAAAPPALVANRAQLLRFWLRETAPSSDQGFQAKGKPGVGQRISQQPLAETAEV